MTVLLQFSPDFDSDKKYENWLIFDEVTRRKNVPKFLAILYYGLP